MGQEKSVKRTAEHRNSMDKAFGFLKSILFPFVGICLWELAARMEWISPFFFPAPSASVAALWDLIQTQGLVHQLGVSLIRLACGFFGGAAVGLAIGLIMGWSPFFRTFLDPLITIFYPLPKVVLFPILILLLGIGETSKVAVIIMGSIFPVLLNTMAAVKGVKEEYLELSKVYGIRGTRLCTQVLLPGSLPIIFPGLRLAMGLSIILLVTVEFLAASNGVGAMIWMAWLTLHIDRLFGMVGLISLLSLFITWLMGRLEAALIPWKG